MPSRVVTPETREYRRRWNAAARVRNKKVVEAKKDPAIHRVMRLLFLTAYATHGHVVITRKRMVELRRIGLSNG